MHSGEKPPVDDNVDPETIRGFGREWATYDQSSLSAEERRFLADRYFGIFPFAKLPPRAEGFDLGCGSGRWAAVIAPQVGTLHCIDPAEEALEVAKANLTCANNVVFHLAGANSIPLPDGSQDFGYCLGVLHHVPDTQLALRSCVRKLRPGAPFLLYLYYDFSNRPAWFRLLWKASDWIRKLVSRLPFLLRRTVSTGIAVAVYWPLARTAAVLEQLGVSVSNFPLSAYRSNSFYTMQTDSLDRFGTRLEQRFSRMQIEQMMQNAGLNEIQFSDREPFWIACGTKAHK